MANDYMNVHPQMPLGMHSVLSRQKGQQMVSTGNQPMNARVQSSMRKNSTGEHSLEQQVSKTPKAPGTQRHANIGDSDITS